MRILSAAVLSLFFSTSAYASVTAEQWQGQLQSEIQRIQTQSPDIRAQGEVVVQESGGQLRAVLPALTVTSPDKSQWSIPSIIMTGSTSSNAVTIALPSTITRFNAAKAPIAKMTLGAQALNGSWNFSSNSFDTLNGTVKNVNFNDTIAHSQSAVGNVAISANKGSAIEFIANDIKNTTTIDQKQLDSSAGKVSLGYQLPDNKLTLPRLIGLFNPSILLTENKEIGITAVAEQLSSTGADNRTTTIQKVSSNWKLQPKGKIIAANTTTQIFIVKQSPESMYGFALPQQLDLNANVANMPLELVSFAPGMSATMAKQTMAKAGTVINIPKLLIKTFDQGTIMGNGSLKANANVPAGFTGRLTLKIENLKQLIATMQAGMLQPDAGSNRAAKTQALMAMMMIQGLGKQNGSSTEFIVDLTAEGQTLVNGQDFSGLISNGKGANSIPALPVIPVTGSNI